MNVTSQAYVQARDGNLYIGNSRVTLDSIILLWKTGHAPEAIHADFPSVPRAAVYGTIAHYLEHQDELDPYLREIEEMRQRQRASAEADDPVRYDQLRRRFANHPPPTTSRLSSAPISRALDAP